MSAALDQSGGEDAQQHVTLRMPATLVTELRAVAEENDRSLSAEARLALRAWLDGRSQKAAA